MSIRDIQMADKRKREGMARMTKQDQLAFRPSFQPAFQGPVWKHGRHVAYNSGILGWNWDLIIYRGQYYIQGLHNIPGGI